MRLKSKITVLSPKKINHSKVVLIPTCCKRILTLMIQLYHHRKKLVGKKRENDVESIFILILY